MHFCSHHRPDRHAGILLTVLIVIALMTVGSAAYFDWTFTEHRATRMFGRQTQARYAAESAIESLQLLLAEDADAIEIAGGLYDNPARFRGIQILTSDAAALRCRFSVIAPNVDYGEYEGYRSGLENESSRLNLNTILSFDDVAENAARDMLMGLPGMTASIADAILDFIDEDDEPRELGAEYTHYASLETPYAPQNGQLESLDQLLRVRDVTPTLLYGMDRNRDFIVDGSEALTVLPDTVDNTTGEMNRGWAAYLTLYSAEKELNSFGEPKININSEDLESLHSELENALGRKEANFIIAIRQSGPKDGGQLDNGNPTDFGGAGDSGSGGGATVSAESVSIDFNSPAAYTVTSLLDLVGTDVEVTQASNTNKQTIKAIFPDDPLQAASYLPELMDNLTIYEGGVIPGRLNINQAPRPLLESLPEMPLDVVERLIANRDFEVDPARPNRKHATWLLAEGYMTLEDMRRIEPYVTGGGDVYRAQAIGFFDAEGPRRRIEAVIDASGDAPIILMQQDLSPLGGGPSDLDLGAEPDMQGTL